MLTEVTVEAVLNAEPEEHLGYARHELYQFLLNLTHQLENLRVTGNIDFTATKSVLSFLKVVNDLRMTG